MSPQPWDSGAPWVPHETDRMGVGRFALQNCFVRAFLQLRWLIQTPLSTPILNTRAVRLTVGELLFFAPLVYLLAMCFKSTNQLTTGGLATLPTIGAFVTAARNSPLTFLLGVPFERRLAYHKLCATAACAAGAWHMSLYYRISYSYSDGGGSGNSSSSGSSDNYSDGSSDSSNSSGGGSWSWTVDWENNPEVSGWVLLGAMLALPLFSVVCLRRRAFNVFYALHWVLFVVVICGCLWHPAGSISYGAALFGVDVLIRYVYEQLFENRPSSARFFIVPGNVVKIVFPREQFRYRGGQYVFLAVKELSMFEWHPFSISSAPHEPDVSIHVRVLGDWTQKLHDLVQSRAKANLDHEVNGVPLGILFEGPHGEIGVDVRGDRYASFLLVSGGIGITPMQSLCNELIDQYGRGRPVQRLWFCWSVRDRLLEEFDQAGRDTGRTGAAAPLLSPRDAAAAADDWDAAVKKAAPLHMVVQTVDEDEEQDAAAAAAAAAPATTGASNGPRRLPLAFQPDLLTFHNSHDSQKGWAHENERVAKPNPLFTQFFLTGSMAAQYQPEKQAFKHVHHGRMDCTKVLMDMKASAGCPLSAAAADSAGEKTVRVAVLFCGPTSLGKDLRHACGAMSDRHMAFDYHEESFEF
eukprot:Rhum_TRINITY_DN14940_c0_g1::Rhum_TRINITY_DN14940_c0_g1_i2::g.128725::m.128725